MLEFFLVNILYRNSFTLEADLLSVVYANEVIKTILSLFYERFCMRKDTHKQKLTNKT